MSYLGELRALVGTRRLLVPSVSAVIHDASGRVLLGRKREDGSWSLPAGAIEPGESPREAIQREVLEETGAYVVTSRLLDVVGGEAFRHTYPNGDEVEYTICVFGCQISEERTGRDGEFVQLEWVASERVAERLILPYPAELFHYPAS